MIQKFQIDPFYVTTWLQGQESVATVTIYCFNRAFQLCRVQSLLNNVLLPPKKPLDFWISRMSSGEEYSSSQMNASSTALTAAMISLQFFKSFFQQVSDHFHRLLLVAASIWALNITFILLYSLTMTYPI